MRPRVTMKHSRSEVGKISNIKMLYQLLFLVVTSVLVGAHTHENHSPLRAIVRLASPDGRDVHGNITLTQLKGKVRVEGSIYGMPQGHYGFHIHETGDITKGCDSTGAHFNPEMKDHGHPEDEVRHVGDLGNVQFDLEKFSKINFEDSLIALFGSHNVIGRAIVLHEMADDYGRSDHPDSKKTGNAGGRVACGVIGILSPVTGWDVSAASRTWISCVTSILLSAFAINLY